jgi:hypothetical protein
MLLSIRAGRSNRPVASFVRLARSRAHRRREALHIGQLQGRSYATEPARSEENGSADSGPLSSMLLSLFPIRGAVSDVSQLPRLQGTMK